MADPERYVTVAELEEEVAFTQSAFDVDDWQGLLQRFLDEESERIEADDFVGKTWDTSEDVPGPVKHGIIRLVRSRLEQIQSDGLESESLPSGQSVSYRPPERVIAAVQATVREFRDDSDGSGIMVI